jgi:hypothetical protein
LTNFADDTITFPTGTGVKTLQISTPSPGATPAVCLSDIIPSADPSYSPYTNPNDWDFNIQTSSTSGEWIAYTAIKPAPSSGGDPKCASLTFELSASATSSDEAFIKAIADTLDFK